MKTFESFMFECPLIAILRGITPPEVESVAEALYDGGIRILEIPLNSPDAFASLVRLSSWAGEKVIAGAGTVLTVDEVDKVCAAGCRFVVSPNTDEEVIARTKESGMTSIPGFFTATEGFRAIRAGADYLKFFPAGSAGASFIKDLKAVIKKPIFAVAGVNEKNLLSFRNVCAGAGIGGGFYTPGKDPSLIRRDCARFVELWRKEEE